MPRQAYEFTHLLLPEEALLAPEVTWITLRGPESTAWLAALWATAYAYANTDEVPTPPIDLQAEQCLAGTHEAVLISLPAPQQPPDAWFALLVRTPAAPAPFRYFLLEVADDFVPPAGGTSAAPGPTQLTERVADTGARRRHGSGPPAPTATTVARLLVAVGRLLAQNQQSPADDEDADDLPPSVTD